MNNFIRNLFRRDKTSTAKVKTGRLSDKRLAVAGEEIESYQPSQMLVGSAHSVGMQRDHNEDALFLLNTTLLEGEEEFPFGIFIVADGMGGHHHGEVASGATVRIMAEYLTRNALLSLLENEARGEPIQELMEDGVAEVQEVVKDKVPGGGTTLTATLVIGEQVTFAHVGDSRVYFIYPDNRTEVITHDHSLVQQLQDLDHITEEDALVHPQRNVLYRAIGQKEPIKPDLGTRRVPKPGSMLLCSDGLWGLVQDDEIARIVNNSSNPSIACHELVKVANKAGGPDNITAVLVEFLP